MDCCRQESAKIREGVFAIVRKVGGAHIRLCRLISGQRVLIERLSFDPKNAIGHFYGIFEVSSGGDVLCPAEDASKPIKIEFSNGTAETLAPKENEGSQQLTSDQITSLKEDGITTNELVSKLISGNCHFQSRTKFSKEKYLQKKVKKHSDRIMILQPNIRLLADCYYRKDPERLGHLRIDQLGLMLQLSALHPGNCNAFVFDQVLGLLGAAVLERIDSHGKCIFLHRGDWPQAIPCLDSFTSDKKKSNGLLTLRITTLLKGEIGRDEEENQKNIGETEEKASVKREEEDGREERREQQIQKKLERAEKERRAMEMLKPTAENGAKIDSICMAIRSVDPLDILTKVFDGLRLSGTVVIYSPVKQHLLSSWKWLRSVGSVVDINLSQQFFRSQQVITDRTHPLMQQLVSGGYVLHAIKVIPPEPDRTQQRKLNNELLAKHSRIEQ